MALVRLTEQAQTGFDALIEYYERVGTAGFADVFKESILSRMNLLARHPRIGRVVPEIEEEAVREVLYRTFRIVYEVSADDSHVSILTIFHSSQDFGGERLA